ncbi:MAG: type VI secretion system tip protein VgrG [Alphaproteobacteria bacterium]|nr:type VI secretion system tip protein VgrG [Alphaproteobacteria bacterium]MBU0795771.1 type VI secretion system tip protein VgrG [Alphaproteobacteria bacterium]MBU0887394.1 type VI secretion system tip protein VgrG [Alphaproteobacteria bacterium]MBU1811725.1 type VI secretion system tip protein VgrG [Alphaproteobacteria bacterium]
MSTPVAAITIKTPLSNVAFTVLSFEAEEQLSTPFRFTATLRASSASVDLASLIGKVVSLVLTAGDKAERCFAGIVAAATQLDADPRGASYRLYIRPALWRLSLASDCRIFQQKTVPEIVQAVLKADGVGLVKNSLSASYDKQDYVVQFDESDLAFVSRLMEQAGIVYFFTHAAAGDTLVLADDSSPFKPIAGPSALNYRQPQGGILQADAVSLLAWTSQMATASVGAGDYSFLIPSTDLTVTAKGKGDSALARYSFPGFYATKSDGEAVAKRQITALEGEASLLVGESACPSLMPGATLSIQGYGDAGVNGKYTLTAVSHLLSEGVYHNRFEALPADTQIRPRPVTPRPRIAGLQTAKVVGKQGEEIWTDKYGRIKLQFPWDRQGKSDENSSCWVRVVQGWAGKGWGHLFVPRIGMEVMVAFVDGDPDRPLVVGALYNAEQTVPATLPGDQTKGMVKTNSSKGGGGFNQLLLDDAKDKELIYLHAQKDMTLDVLNNRTATVTQDEKLTVSKGDRTIEVSAGKETHSVKQTRDVTVTGKETHTNKADFDQTVDGNMSLTVKGNYSLTVQGSITIKATGAVTIESSAGAVTVKAAQSLQTSGMTISNKATTSLTNDGGMSITNTAQGKAALESSGMVTVNGAMVKIN